MDERTKASSFDRPEPPGPKTNHLLASLPSADVSLLMPHLVETMLWRGQILQKAHQPVTSTFFPVSGLVSLLCASSDGRSIETASVGRNGVIGLSIGKPRASCSAIVRLPGIAWSISSEELTELSDQLLSLRRLIIRSYEDRVRELDRAIVCALSHPIHARVSRWLLQAHDRTGSTEFSLTQDVLAEMLGVQRTTVSVVCTTLQSKGIIDTHRGVIRIKDMEMLRATACSCHSATGSAVENAPSTTSTLTVA